MLKSSEDDCNRKRASPAKPVVPDTKHASPATSDKLDTTNSFLEQADDPVESPRPPKSNPRLSCTLCPFTTTHGRRLREHMDRHNLPEFIQCPFCPYSIDWGRKPQFKMHLFKHIEEELQCKWCPFKTPSMHYFQQHYKTHVRILTCTHCSFTTKYSDTYEEHIAKHVIEEREQAGVSKAKECPACDTVFETKLGLKKHISTHRETTVSCRYCKFKTGNMRNLLRHALKRHFVSV